MGLSAAVLLRLSAKRLPAFEEIFDPNSIGYPVSMSHLHLCNRIHVSVQCAATVLGLGQPEATYRTIGLKVWREAVERQWHHSGLPNALHRLTSDLVEQAKQRILVSEGEQLYKQIRKINNNQQCGVLVLSSGLLKLISIFIGVFCLR